MLFFLSVFSDTVQVFSEDFLDIDLQDERMKHLKVILMMAECTKSGVANPVNFIVTEGEGRSPSYNVNKYS